jgi:hypothetical protein
MAAGTSRRSFAIARESTGNFSARKRWFIAILTLLSFGNSQVTHRLTALIRPSPGITAVVMLWFGVG